jgi:hypothetical protein
MVSAGKFKSPTVSNTNELPAEQPFIASAVKIQSTVRGFAARKRVAKVLEKQRKNRGKRQIRQQNKKKKGKKNADSKKNVSSNVLEHLLPKTKPSTIFFLSTGLIYTRARTWNLRFAPRSSRPRDVRKSRRPGLQPRK